MGALPRKPDYWTTNIALTDNIASSYNDIYVSVDGKVICVAGNNILRYSVDFGITWNSGNYGAGNINFTSICGNSQGSLLFAFGRNIEAGTLLLYTSVPVEIQNVLVGQNWTQITSSAFSGLTTVNRFRCSGDATYLIASINDLTNTGARCLYSSNQGAIWTVKQIDTSLTTSGYTNGVCMSRSGVTQYIIWAANDNNSSRIYRSLDYGATFQNVINQQADDLALFAPWYRIECDATGRFVYANRYLNTTTFPRLFRSQNYGGNWDQIGSSGWLDIWVSGTGQFIAGILVPYLSNVAVSFSNDYGRTYGFSATNTNIIYSCFGGCADGSVLVTASTSSSGDGRIRIAREGQQNIQDLTVVGGTISKASGTYTLTNDVVLWFSGNVTITSVTNKINLPFTSAGKIDLALYNLKYEIDINWDWQSVTAPANSFISMGFQTSTIPPSGVKAANTIWTRNSQTTASPQTNTPSIFDQVFNDVFICGYAAGQVTGEAYRYRTMMNGELSRATTRPQQYSGDFAPNSRLIMNRFLADTVLYDNVNGASQLKFYPPAGDSQGQMQIAGTAVWEMAYNNLYNDIAAGIDNIFINFSSTADMATSATRAGYITYRIYRVRK